MADRDSVAKKEKSVTDKQKNSSSPKTMYDFHLDEWIRFRMDSQSAHQLFSLRQKWQVRSHFFFVTQKFFFLNILKKILMDKKKLKEEFKKKKIFKNFPRRSELFSLLFKDS